MERQRYPLDEWHLMLITKNNTTAEMVKGEEEEDGLGKASIRMATVNMGNYAIVCAIELKFRAGIPTIPILFVESVSFLERFPL